MKYDNIVTGRFLTRPNRFIAHIEIDGEVSVCHVKNTGRCKELLTEGAEVYLETSKNPERKTKYDLIAVKKGNTLINLDSQAPNKVFYEWARVYFGEKVKMTPEKRYKNSRFDYYIEKEDQKIWVEVKGVTLEENGVARFPDAPTERGIKHLKELCDAVAEGYTAYMVFVVQMKGIKYFEPNIITHKAFGDALEKAHESGVNILCIDCKVTPDTLVADKLLNVYINGKKIK